MASDRFFDCSKAKKELGWKPGVGFVDGLKEAVDEYSIGKTSQA
jgi:nucleoside-diphosphate-sugar epimerase